MTSIPPGSILLYSNSISDWQEFQLAENEYLIGRAGECDIQLEDQEVSRFHATLKVTPDGFWLLDMGSTNGILVDDKRLPPNRRFEIKPDQEFVIGPYTLKIKLPKKTVPHTSTMVGMKVPELNTYDVEKLRVTEFSHMLGMTYLNNAGAAPMPKRVLEKIQSVTSEMIANAAWHVGERLFEAYGVFLSTLEKYINTASPEELVVISSRSSGINMIAQSIRLEPGDNIAFCDQEHPANALAWLSLERNGYEVKQIPAQDGGLVLSALEQAVDNRTKVVTASAVQFFTGHRTDIEAIGKFCRDRDIIFVVDASQAIGHLPIDVQKMQIDVLVSGAHKSLMAGPGAGFMYVREALVERLDPRQLTSVGYGDRNFYLKYDLNPGKDAIRFFMGTPHVAGMLGMLECIKLIEELKREAIDIHTTNLAAYTIETARSKGYEVATTRGEHGPIATLNSGLDLDQTKVLVRELEERQVFTVGYPDKRGVPHLRISFHCYNERDDVDLFFDALTEVKDKLQT